MPFRLLGRRSAAGAGGRLSGRGLRRGSAIAAGCAPAGQRRRHGSRKLRIAVIPKGTTHEFWKSVHAGAANAAKELGDVEILWKGSLLESDRETADPGDAGFHHHRKVDGICLAPNDSQALVEYVNQAVQEKIPVVIFDSGIDDHRRS